MEFLMDEEARDFKIVSDTVTLSYSFFTELLLYLQFDAFVWPKWSGLNFVNSILDWFSFLFRPFLFTLLLLTSSLSSIIFFMFFIIRCIDEFKVCLPSLGSHMTWYRPHKKIGKKLLAKWSCSVCIFFWALPERTLHPCSISRTFL